MGEHLTNKIKMVRIREGRWSLFFYARKQFQVFKKSLSSPFSLRNLSVTQLRFGGKGSSMKKFMTPRAYGALAVLVAAFALQACGGGGGGGTTTPPPVAQQPSWSNAVVPTAQAPASAQAVAASAPRKAAAQPADPWNGVEKVSASDQLLDFGQTFYSQYFPGARATAVFEQYRYRYFPETTCYLGVDQNTAGVHVMGCGFGTSPVYVGQLTQFILPTNPSVSWWPPTFIQPGNNVTADQVVRLPAGCTSETQTCYQDLVKTGAVKTFSTPAVMVGAASNSSRPIAISLYKENTPNAVNGLDVYHFHLVFADTGEKATGSDIMDSGFAADLDYVRSNDQGALFRDKREGGVCRQFKWNPPTTTPGVSSNVWNFGIVPCP